jgi:imidazolonepropionase-like amidohydrolase
MRGGCGLLRAGLLVTSMCAATASSASAQGRAAPQAIVFDHVTVVDVRNGLLRGDETVVVTGNRIVSVGPSGTATKPPGARVVDGGGKYLIPGLWDMHTHLFLNSQQNGADMHELFYPLYIANGVTGLRDMWTTLEELAVVREWNAATRDGRMVGPRVVGTSTMLNGERNSIIVASPAMGRRVVDSLVAGGARSIKVQNTVPRDAFFAIAAEARTRGVPLIGHVPISVRAWEAADSGQRSMEHLLGIPDGCSSREAEILRIRNDTTRARVRGGLADLVQDSFDESTCQALAHHLAQLGVWVVPTSVVKRIGLPDDSLRAHHRGFQYAPAPSRSAWLARDSADRALPTATIDMRRKSFSRGLAIVGLLHRAGVPLLAGTDLTNNWLTAGFSLQDELALLVDAGLSPLDALRTATWNPAKYFGADSLGLVERGKVADLVLLDADPLANILNTRAIHAVMSNGRLFDRAQLDSLLAAAEQRATTWPRPR